MATAEPPAKKAKTDDASAKESTKTIAKAAEPPLELEEDALVDKRGKIKDGVCFLPQDCTMNVADSIHGKLLTCLSEGGLQYLLAGARANVGIKSGRYMFETNVVELMHEKQDTANVAGKVPQPRHFFRVGLSTSGSSLMLGEDQESICFDAEGSLIHNKKKTQIGSKFERSMHVCLLLNLDPKSPNENTVSLFRDGVRICKPQALPESLVGQALYPSITYRNVTVHYNFGPAPNASLPFACRMVQDAAIEDVDVTANEGPEDGHCTAIFPVCLPDEGGFQWLDSFLGKNPGYTELSDRAILNWAQKSGVARLKPYTSRICNDKPDMSFGLPLLDDSSVQRFLLTVAPLLRRNFVVMEMRGMLMKDERAKLLSNFGQFKKVAIMIVGEPSKAFKNESHQLILQEKQEASDAEFKKKLEREKVAEQARKQAEKKKREEDKQKKKEEKEKKKAEEKKKKEQEDRMKKLQDVKKREEEKKKKVEEQKKAQEERDEEAIVIDDDEKQDAGLQGGVEGEATKQEESETKEDEQEEAKDEAMEETKEEDGEEQDEEEEELEMEVGTPDPEPPVVELSDEEEKLWFKPSGIPDLATLDLNRNFAAFTLPEKSDGFDEMKYEWQDEEQCSEHIAKWQQMKKLTARIEDLVPGDWFSDQQKEWSKFLTKCKAKQNEYKTALAKKIADKAAKEKLKRMLEVKAKARARMEAERAAKKKEKEEKEAKEKAEKEARAAAEGEVDNKEAEEEKKERVKKPEEEREADEDEPMDEDEAAKIEEDEEEAEPIDFEGLDVFGVDDVFDVGGSPPQPLFSEFQLEDWTLMTLRFELNLLLHSFKKDVKDVERTSIHQDNIAYYYSRYFRKQLSPGFFGLKNDRELLAFLSDTVCIYDKVLHSALPADLESMNMFVLLAEEARRDRLRRADLGETGAQIKISSGQFGLGPVSLPAGAGIPNASAQQQKPAGGAMPSMPNIGVRPGVGSNLRPSIGPYQGQGQYRPPTMTQGPAAGWRPAAPAYGNVAARPGMGMARRF